MTDYVIPLGYVSFYKLQTSRVHQIIRIKERYYIYIIRDSCYTIILILPGVLNFIRF